MKKSGFMEGAIIATLAIFLSKFLGIIYAIPFNALVGDKGGALYGYAYQIYNLFLVISTAGIPLAISKLTSEYNALNKTVEKEYMFKVAKKVLTIISIILFLILFIFAKEIALFIKGDMIEGNTIADITFVLRCVSFAILVVPILSISRGYLQGHGYISAPSLSQVIEQVVRVAVILGGSFLTLKVFHLSLKTAIGISVFGATAGALVAYLYLANKLFKVKREKKVDTSNLNKEERKEIIKKIIMYAIPFIILNGANNLYNTTDMILLNRGLNMIGLNSDDIEAIISVFTTWGSKINVIITSIATGIAISLVPSVTKSNTKGDLKSVNSIFNKSLQIFFYVALPLAIFISIFSKEVWTIFFGTQNKFGPIILKYSIITAGVDALYILICNGVQGLNKSKLIYVSIFCGLIVNIFLDVPLILLFNKWHLYPYYGAITSTILGYLTSLIIPLFVLKFKYHLSYEDTLKKIPKLLLVYILMIFLSLIYRGIINNIVNRIYLILLLGIIGIILLVIYYFLNKKEIEEIVGSNIMKKIKRRKD